MNATMFFLFLSTKNEPGPVGGQEPGDWRGRGYAACLECYHIALDFHPCFLQSCLPLCGRALRF